MGILFMSKSIPLECLIFLSASLIMDSVLSPKKSIFIRPIFSITLPEYCVTNTSSLTFLSMAVESGANFLKSSAPIITPHACIPVCLTVPSRREALSRVSFISNLLLYKSLIKGISFMQLLMLTGSDFPFASTLSSGNLSGMASVISLTISNGMLFTLATSFILDFVAIVPYVMMCATFSFPYFSVTHFNTSFLPSSSKSISISGSEIRSGFKNLSNSKSYFIGSISVIVKQ